MNEKINIGIVGLGFGKEFIQIYQNHPNVVKWQSVRGPPKPWPG